MIGIRRITEQELAYASELAKVVYRSSIEPNCADERLRKLFEAYVDRDALAKRFREGQLLLWGAFEENRIYGVGGMQPEGHITMLYVLPAFQRRNIGRNLMSMMENYAFSELKLPRVTVSAMPSFAAPYFENGQFRLLPGQEGGSFVYLEKVNPAFPASYDEEKRRAEDREPREYRAKPIPVPEILILSLGTLAMLILLSVIYAVSTIL